jgi:hypothetical protein
MMRNIFDTRRVLFFSCFVLLVTSGCISNAKIIRENKAIPAAFSAAALNGTYSNADLVSKNFLTNNTLWTVLYESKFHKRDTTKYTGHALVNLN